MTATQKFIEMLQNDSKLETYKRLEIKINSNKELEVMMAQLKNLQKQMINAQKIEKPKAYEKINQTYNELLDKVLEYPLMAQYLELQDYFNQILSETTKIIENQINNDLEL